MARVKKTTIKKAVDDMMGRWAGDGVGPTEAARELNAQFNTRLTPQEVWNIWLEETEEEGVW